MNSGTATGVAVAMSDAATGSLKGTGSSITKAIAADSTATMPMQAGSNPLQAVLRPEVSVPLL